MKNMSVLPQEKWLQAYLKNLMVAIINMYSKTSIQQL